MRRKLPIRPNAKKTAHEPGKTLNPGPFGLKPPISAEAKLRGKGVHMGRVNSYRRIAIADAIGCDTADGTYIAFGPDVNLPKALAWLTKLEAVK